MSGEAHTRPTEGRLTRGDYGEWIEQEVGMVWDSSLGNLGWRPALAEETPTAWGVWDSSYGWLVDPRP